MPVLAIRFNPAIRDFYQRLRAEGKAPKVAITAAMRNSSSSQPPSSSKTARGQSTLDTQYGCWLFWQVGSTPFLGGGFGHFYAYAPTKIRYAIDRYALEVKRQLDVLDRRLAESEYIAGPNFSIANIAIWPWYGGVASGQIYDAADFLSVQDYPHLQRWVAKVGARPAVGRGALVNRAYKSTPD